MITRHKGPLLPNTCLLRNAPRGVLSMFRMMETKVWFGFRDRGSRFAGGNTPSAWLPTSSKSPFLPQHMQKKDIPGRPAIEQIPKKDFPSKELQENPGALGGFVFFWVEFGGSYRG